MEMRLTGPALFSSSWAGWACGEQTLGPAPPRASGSVNTQHTWAGSEGSTVLDHAGLEASKQILKGRDSPGALKRGQY